MQNTSIPLQDIEIVLSFINRYKRRVSWILDLGFRFDRIANFGCSTGIETLALLWLLSAKEAVGVDKNKSRIQQAYEFIEEIKSIRRTLSYGTHRISEIYRTKYFKEYIEGPLPSFEIADITEKTSLPDNYFDLVYCESVLYHIACDDNQIAEDNVFSAIQEIERVMKFGGLMVAIEHVTCSPDNDRPVQLDQFFCRASLIKLRTKDGNFSPEGKNVYLYSKPEKEQK